MMFATLPPLPANADDFIDWDWAAFAPYFEELQTRPLSTATVDMWLADWTAVNDRVNEIHTRLRVATNVDTTDEAAEKRLSDFMDTLYPQSQAAGQALKRRLLESGLIPDDFAVPLRNLSQEVTLFREENLPLQAEESRLNNNYNRIIGLQSVVVDGEEQTVTRLRTALHTPDRERRETIWQAIAGRRLDDRESLNALWTEMLNLRQQMANNAGFPDYRTLRWQQLLRFDYSPEDSARFHQAIADEVVPAAGRVYERYAGRLGVERLRPWDVEGDVYPLSLEAERPFADEAELVERSVAVLKRVDPELGGYMATMAAEGLLNLANRPGKAPGGYCTYFPVAKRPYIFMNAVGLPGDVKTMLHEAGHAFHNFERSRLAYFPQRRVTAEFAEVASMAMELLAAPYLRRDEGGFYDEEALRQARLQHLEKIILFWPYMAIVDGFQHWAYTHVAEAQDPAARDAHWAELWQRFLPFIDWEGEEETLVTGWQRKQHIFRYPFYYIEYGMAQVGAIQVWQRAQTDQATAVRRYRQALALGGTRTLPELFAAAGAAFAFDHRAMADIVSFLESEIAALESASGV